MSHDAILFCAGILAGLVFTVLLEIGLVIVFWIVTFKEATKDSEAKELQFSLGTKKGCHETNHV